MKQKIGQHSTLSNLVVFGCNSNAMIPAQMNILYFSQLAKRSHRQPIIIKFKYLAKRRPGSPCHGILVFLQMIVCSVCVAAAFVGGYSTAVVVIIRVSAIPNDVFNVAILSQPRAQGKNSIEKAAPDTKVSIV